jgi:hypothetical protein
MPRIPRSLAWWLGAAAIAVPLPVHAQTTGDGLAHLIPNLILRGITLPGGDAPGNPHAGHFTLGDPTRGSQPASQADIPTIQAVAAFGDRLRAQLANFPLGSSTGGFTFSFDEGSGVYTRNTESFGPSFTERAATIGRKKLSIGANYQHSSFDTFAGENLRDGSIKFYLPHTDCCGGTAPAPPSEANPGFESDIMQTDLRIQATTDTFALFANYGVTNRFDVGVAIPITRVDLEVDVHAHILRLSTFDSSRVHTFVDGQDVSERTFSQAGSATGLGDIVLRTKFNLFNRGATGISAAADFRLPTGDENDLLGLGTAQAKIFMILSSTAGRISPHVNLGFTISGEGDRETRFNFQPLGVSDEVNYAGGIEFVAHPRLTLIADMLGRTLMDAGNVDLEARTFQVRPGSRSDTTVQLQASTVNPNTGAPYLQLALRDGNLTQMLGSTGFKYNAGPNLLVMGSVLFPLNKEGLRDRATFSLGFDYAF